MPLTATTTYVVPIHWDGTLLQIPHLSKPRTLAEAKSMITERRLPVTHCMAENHARIAAPTGATQSAIAIRTARQTPNPTTASVTSNESLRHSRASGSPSSLARVTRTRKSRASPLRLLQPGITPHSSMRSENSGALPVSRQSDTRRALVCSQGSYCERSPTPTRRPRWYPWRLWLLPRSPRLTKSGRGRCRTLRRRWRSCSGSSADRAGR